MAAEDVRVAAAEWELVGLPQPMAVRDPDTGRVVDGYRIVVKSKKTGATAEVEIPKDRFSTEYVHHQATEHLKPLDEVVANFGKAGMRGAPPAASS